MRPHIRTVFAVILAATTVLATGCGKTIKKVNLVTSGVLNPLPPPDSTSAGVNVVVYYLGDAAKFQNATFDELWNNDEATLGADLIDPGKQERFMHPDTSEWVIDLPNEKGKQVPFLGIFAIFRDHTEDCWRCVVDTKSIRKSVTITLEGYCVRLGAAAEKTAQSGTKEKSDEKGPKRSEH